MRPEDLPKQALRQVAPTLSTAVGPRSNSSTAGGGKVEQRDPPSAVEIEQQRRVVTEGTRPPSRSPAPRVPDVAETRAQRMIDEGLVDPKAVAPVRRVPGVRARPATQEPERVEPAQLPEGAQPRHLLRPERRGFLVDVRQAGVRVADEQR